jgi:uncharacterized membrane protein (DUF485 family)
MVSTRVETSERQVVDSRPEPDFDDVSALEAIASRRLRVALALTAAMLVVYFGFILLIAFAKDFLSRTITDGLSVGMALGVVVILATWALTWIYVRWANRVYEPALDELREHP